MTNPMGYGLIGCGAFGQFCLQSYQSLPGLRLVAVTDANADLARSVAATFKLQACDSVEQLLARDDLGIVHIATPPATHHPLVTQALHAGKHVLCEKPLAIDPQHARTMIELARQQGRILTVNLIMRYNPLATAIKSILEQRLLGEALHGSFENNAKDQPLGPRHWFWDPAQSGGIFIEHGVHFFDLFAMWFGEGRLLTATQSKRPQSNPSLIEQVQCIASHGPGVLVDYYHGFHQANVMDRQTLRIVCEHGEIELEEWLATRVRVDALVDRATAARIADLLPHGEMATSQTLPEDQRAVTSRHKSYRADGRFSITGDAGRAKSPLYQHVLRELLADQIAGANDPGHARRVTEANGLTSLIMASEATALAQGSSASAG